MAVITNVLHFLHDLAYILAGGGAFGFLIFTKILKQNNDLKKHLMDILEPFLIITWSGISLFLSVHFFNLFVEFNLLNTLKGVLAVLMFVFGTYIKLSIIPVIREIEIEDIEGQMDETKKLERSALILNLLIFANLIIVSITFQSL